MTPPTTVHQVTKQLGSVSLNEKCNYPNPFTSTTFPPNASSIWGDKKPTEEYKGLVWLRPSQMDRVTKPQLFTNGFNVTDPHQGFLGDCAVISSFCVASSSFSAWWKKVYCEEKSDPDNGKYCFKFFELGEWKDVIIDDYIPCYKEKTPIFAHSLDPNELWVSLLEKAFAAFFGSYMALTSGLASEYLHCLTGGVPFYHEVRDLKLDEVWKLLSSEPAITKYICAGTDRERNSIVSCHSYSIIKCYEMGRHKLIRMKNPWGNKEWSGLWSDTDSRWTAEMKKTMEKDGHVFGRNDDGIFFMDLDSFCKTWQRLSGCFVYGGSYESMSFTGSLLCEKRDYWVDAVLQETQYHLDLKEDTEIKFCLSRKSKRFINDEINEETSLNIFIRTSDYACQSKVTDAYEGDFVRNASGQISSHFSCATFLKKGKYVVCPYGYKKFKKAENNKYLLTMVFKHQGMCDIQIFN